MNVSSVEWSVLFAHKCLLNISYLTAKYYFIQCAHLMHNFCWCFMDIYIWMIVLRSLWQTALRF